MHCVRCHQHFSCGSACDKHLVFANPDDQGYCLPPQDIRDKWDNVVLVSRRDKYGATWHYAAWRDPWAYEQAASEAQQRRPRA